MNDKERETILFVDDEKDLLTLAGEYFRRKGFKMFTAKNGEEAVEILKHERIDCCFTDLNMPGMDGLELAEHIRQLDNSIPVIVVTGYPSLDSAVNTLKNGVVDFLIKPVRFSMLEACLGRVLRERRLLIDNIFLKKELEGKSRLEALNRELTNKVEELNTLNMIMSNLSSIDASSDIFKCMTDLATEITNADESRFYVINDDIQQPFQVAASYGSAGKTCDDAFDDVAELLMETVNDKIPFLVAENKNVRGLPEKILSFMAVPLKIRERVFGILVLHVTDGDIRFDKKDLFYMSFLTMNAASSIENIALYDNIFDNLFSTLYAFVQALEARDPYTRQHSDRVAQLSVSIAREMGCSTEDIDIIDFAGRLHDIGKIGVMDKVLLKPGKLTDEEFDMIKKHPVIGAKIIGQLGMWDREREIIKYHHERFDGTGYPEGLKRDRIPFLARILAVADAFDAMDSDRAYRKRMQTERIMDIINKAAGTQFDPDVVKVFQKLYEQGNIQQIKKEQ
ncbi:MAG: response regulator [Desulfosarcina sp.]|nr:response regulator [Desulfobacterales bacterium]